MTTSYHIHVIDAPITEDHLLVCLDSYIDNAQPAWSAAYDKAFTEGRALTDDEVRQANEADAPHIARVEAARAAIAADEALVTAAIAAYEEETGPDARRDPFPSGETWDAWVRRTCSDAFMQMHLLAPNLYIGESNMADEDHPIYGLVERRIVIDEKTTSIILDAVRKATSPDAGVPDEAMVAAFLSRHAGKTAFITGH